MKRILQVVYVLFSLLLFVSTGWSLNIYDTTLSSYIDVGSLDIYKASENLTKSSDANELDFVNRVVFGYDYLTNGSDYYTVYNKQDYQPIYYSVYDLTSSFNPLTDTYAFEFESESEYFLIKFGDANASYVSHVVWQNVSAFDWGVVDLSGLNILNMSAFSHWGEVGGTAPVPEPATMVLLGTGLMSLAGASRKKFFKKS